MTNQAKTAIAQMKAAGFERHQFQARTERIYRATYAKEGVRNPYDYGKTLITVSGAFRDGVYINSSRMIEEKVEAIKAAGLGVERAIYKNGFTVYLIRTDYNLIGKLVEYDFREDKSIEPYLDPRKEEATA